MTEGAGSVIANAAKQSIFPLITMDCFVATLLAMTAETTNNSESETP